MANKTRAARGLFYSHKETQEDTKNTKNSRDDSGHNVDLDYLKQFGWMVPFVPSSADVRDAALTDDAQQKSRRGPKPMPATEPSDIQGLNYFDKLKPLLARLHEVGTERDKADRVRATCRDALRFLCLFVFFVASKNANCAWLFSSHKETQRSTKNVLPMSLDDYLKLLDWTGRQFRTGMRGAIPATCAPILNGLNCSKETWFDLVRNFRKRVRHEAGSLLSVRAFRSKRRERRAQAASV